VDAYDFASGTSSRSTKMAHGGIRYFENMMYFKDPVENYRLLKETLHERNYFLYAAPYLNKELGLVIPSKSFLAAAFFYFPGCLLYHMIYLKELMNSNYTEAISGPRVLLKSKMAKMFEHIPNIHG
jgi:glycerol-3-phosphate dehydrogenase